MIVNTDGCYCPRCGGMEHDPYACQDTSGTIIYRLSDYEQISENKNRRERRKEAKLKRKKRKLNHDK